MVDSNDDRSKVAIGYQWACRITGVCLQMVIPLLMGYYLDQRLGIVPVLTLLGLAFGMWLGGMGLLRIVKQSERNSSRSVAKKGKVRDVERE